MSKVEKYEFGALVIHYMPTPGTASIRPQKYHTSRKQHNQRATRLQSIGMLDMDTYRPRPKIAWETWADEKGI